MAYKKINWENSPSTQTPISAENLRHMDEGIAGAHQAASEKIPTSSKGKPNGVPELDETGKVPKEQLPELGEKYDVGGDSLGLVKNGGNVTINPDGTMTAPEADISAKPTYEETDRYYFEGLEERLVLANYGILLPFEGITSAYKLKADITKEQLATITEVRLASYVNWDSFTIDLTQPIFANNDGSVYLLGDLGCCIVGFTPGAILQVPINETMILPIPVPSKGIFIVIPDESYNMLANNCVAYIIGGTIIANKYTQIDNKYLHIPDIDIPEEIGEKTKDGGIIFGSAKNAYLHGVAMGWEAESLAQGAFAIGSATKGIGYDSIVIGQEAVSDAPYSIAIGRLARTRNAVKEGVAGAAEKDNRGLHSVAIGMGVQTASNRSTAIGNFNIPDYDGKYAFIVGNGTSDTNRKNALTIDWNSNAIFSGNTTFSKDIQVKGNATFSKNIQVNDKLTATGAALGWSAEAGGQSAVAIGAYAKANYQDSVAIGPQSETNAGYSFTLGWNCKANGVGAVAIGKGLISKNGATLGSYNEVDTDDDYAYILGGGTSNTDRRNLYTVDKKGNAWYTGSITSTGADYAEYFEWLDGNPENEDRVGLLVALDGEKIKLANDGDEILGIISGTAAVLGDNYEWEWNGKYLTDDFGRIIYDMVEEFAEIPHVEIDDEGNRIEIVDTVSLGFFKHPRLNPDYDPTQQYVNRADRPEWDTVGMLGKLYVKDDGTCEVNRYATVGENGVATKSDEKTNMRVLSRVNENIVRVLLK